MPFVPIDDVYPSSKRKRTSVLHEPNLAYLQQQQPKQQPAQPKQQQQQQQQPKQKNQQQQQRQSSATNSVSNHKTSSKTHIHPSNLHNSYDDPDLHIDLPKFEPLRPAGIHLESQNTRNHLVKAIDFFEMFFTKDVIDLIVQNTNLYANIKITEKQSYATPEGHWKETTATEIKTFISLVIYQGLVRVSRNDRYWSTRSLYHGLWTRNFMSRNRYQAILGMLHIADPLTEDPLNKLRKVDEFVNIFRDKCKQLYQPSQYVAVDERLVKSKHRSGMRQYIANKPAKFGLKLWVIADSSNGYTYDFYVYTGKTNEVYTHGLGHHVVMKLVQPLLNQGYHVFFDNFYTSMQLLKDLFAQGTPSCGTVTENRKGFPNSMKQGKNWAKKRERGEMRWKREGQCLALQWVDNKVVTMLSTIDNANDFVSVDRKKKVDGKWETLSVRKPFTIERYNKYMNAVDRSDQLLAKYNLLNRKSVRWWKTLFFHVIDIAVVNSFILLQQHRMKMPTCDVLKRHPRYSLLDFREELIRNTMNFEEYAQPPVYKVFHDPGIYESSHLPVFGEIKRNCRVCYRKEKKELKVYSFCKAAQCKGVFLHCTKDKNCFSEWHSNDFQKKY